jgi:hypothetical protein
MLLTGLVGACTRRTDVRSATLGGLGSLTSMRIRLAIATIFVLAFLTLSAASTARSIRRPLCVPGHSHLIVAGARAEIFEAPEPPGPPEYLGVWGCVYGHRAYFLGPLPTLTRPPAGSVSQLKLAGSMAAYEEGTSEPHEGTEKMEWRVVVRDLRNGRIVHRVPSGIPLQPEAGQVGVGNVLSLIVKSDGSAAWIVEDLGRSKGGGTLSSETYFDLEEVDKSGMRLVASGTNIDPSSLALSITGGDISGELTSRQGDTLYWTQGGQRLSALLK